MQEALVDRLCGLLRPLLGHLAKPSTLSSLLLFITGLDISLRKQLITLCRGLSIPSHGTSLFAKTSHILTLISRSSIHETITNLYTNPLTNGLLIALSISLPLSDKAIRETYTRMLAKEMMVMETSPLPSIINYNCFFGAFNEPIHPSLPANPRQASAINAIIDRWILSLETKPLITPHITNKLCSKATQDLVRDRYPDYTTFEEEGATQADLEYLYMVEGDKLLDSPSEVKQRWYTSQLLPRTYYAAGAEAYHKSKYLRDALNSLCDFLPPTERFARVNPHRILLSSAQSHAIIYDLTSFTSNMHEQRHFLERLALYCRGHTVRILDACEGVIDVDLGVLLSEYNELNTQSRYSSTRLLGSNLELAHHVAGFLGVFGNLSSCTFLHGAVMSQLVENFSQLGVAGDDGCIDSLDDYTTYFVIRLLGLAEDSKGYTTLDAGNQIYLKRPIHQVLGRLFSESFALYSMIEHLFEEDDKRFFPTRRAKHERLGSLASSIISYLRSLTRIQLSAIEREGIFTFLQGIYRLSGFPEAGHVPYIHTEYPNQIGRLPVTLIPAISLEGIGQEPIEITIKSLYDGVAVLPERIDEPILLDNDSCYAGSSFICTGSSVLSYYRKLGFVELLQGEVVYTGEDGLQRLLRHYSYSRDYAVYTVNVLRDVPDHLLT
jgi:hypothetical protein